LIGGSANQASREGLRRAVTQSCSARDMRGSSLPRARLFNLCEPQVKDLRFLFIVVELS